MARRVWKINDRAPGTALQGDQCPGGHLSLAAKVLAARGFVGHSDAESFMCGGELCPPESFADMAAAVRRIGEAIESGEKIVVFGDYDCDGICSTALLFSYLEAVGADVLYYIPDRAVEGYGLNTQAIDFLKKVRNIDLIITVDNGISAHAEVEHAAALGIDVVVTDHHRPQATLPAAVAVVNPHRADCPSSFKDYAGVGVAFKLICALEGESGDELFEHYGDLVALGTIADVVPLVGENRTLVRRGLELLALGERPGIGALLRVAGLAGKPLDAQAAAFGLAPRINAAGRMGDVYDALLLLLCDEANKADEYAASLEEYNRSRKVVENTIYDEILAKLEAEPQLLNQRVLLVPGEGWHQGVIGILCSRIVERFGKPCFLLSLENGTYRASGRSVPGVSVIEALQHCAGHLGRYGGHPMAAGFEVAAENLPGFISDFYGFFREHYPVMPHSTLSIDAEVEPAELTLAAAEELALLEPYGQSNERPAFSLMRCTLAAITPIGDRKHLRLTLTKGAPIECLYFGMRPEQFTFAVGAQVDVAFEVSVNEYNGRRSPSLRVLDIRAAAGGDTAPFFAGAAKWEAYLRGELPPGGAAELLPSRDEVGVIYRHLRRSTTPQSVDLLCDYFEATEGIPFGRAMAALTALGELGLLELCGIGYERLPVLAPAPPKMELMDSPLLQALSAV